MPVGWHSPGELHEPDFQPGFCTLLDRPELCFEGEEPEGADNSPAPRRWFDFPGSRFGFGKTHNNDLLILSGFIASADPLTEGGDLPPVRAEEAAVILPLGWRPPRTVLLQGFACTFNGLTKDGGTPTGLVFTGSMNPSPAVSAITEAGEIIPSFDGSLQDSVIFLSMAVSLN